MIFCIIINKFSYRLKLGLVLLFVINKNLEIDLYYTILFLGLTISLGVKIGEKLLLNSKEVIQQ